MEPLELGCKEPIAEYLRSNITLLKPGSHDLGVFKRLRCSYRRVEDLTLAKESQMSAGKGVGNLMLAHPKLLAS